MLENGQIIYNNSQATNGGYSVSTVASFSCNIGFSQSGPSSSTCQTSGNWNQQTPTCIESNKNNILSNLKN